MSPQFSNAPEGMNKIMEEVYSGCIAKGNSEKKCSMIAIGAAKRAGYIKAGGVWKKLGSKRIK